MDEDRFNDRARKFQHQRNGLRTGSEHLVGDSKLINARQQFAVDFNKASGSMFAQLPLNERYPPYLGFSFTNVGGAGVRSP